MIKALVQINAVTINLSRNTNTRPNCRVKVGKEILESAEGDALQKDIYRAPKPALLRDDLDPLCGEAFNEFLKVVHFTVLLLDIRVAVQYLSLVIGLREEVIEALLSSEITVPNKEDAEALARLKALLDREVASLPSSSPVQPLSHSQPATR